MASGLKRTNICGVVCPLIPLLMKRESEKNVGKRLLHPSVIESPTNTTLLFFSSFHCFSCQFTGFILVPFGSKYSIATIKMYLRVSHVKRQSRFPPASFSSSSPASASLFHVRVRALSQRVAPCGMSSAAHRRGDGA